MSFTRHQNAADLSGAAVGILCSIHCAVTPLLFITHPLLDSYSNSNYERTIWVTIDWIFLALSLGAVWYSAKYTSHHIIRYFLWFFWMVLAAGLFLEMLGFAEGKWFMYSGSSLLAIVHISNFRYCKNCDKHNN